MNSIAPGEIVYCNLHLKTKKATVISKEKIFSREYDKELQLVYSVDDNKDAIFLKRNNITVDCTIVKIEILKRLGFKNDAGYTTAKKSETDERQKNGTFV